HMDAKHKPTFDCVECSRSFRTQVSLDEHYRGSPNHPNCRVCGRGFRTQDLHHDGCHPQSTCETCRLTMYDEKMPKHYRQSPQHPKCRSCDQGFANDTEFNLHCTTVHSNVQCVECDQQFFDAEALQNHYNNSLQHPKCKRCGKGFANENKYATVSSIYFSLQHGYSSEH
ncbi:hypothetical protein F5146DRAFT_937192, partial [Armillaria mellea]